MTTCHLLLYLSLGATRTVAGTEPPPEVSLAGGRVVGGWRDDIREFLGVPFATPPVGSLRWLPPEPVQPWAPRTVYANKVSAGCIRTDTWYTLNPVMSEDCLYLNLWAPPESQLQGRLAPVMVWIFGGGFYTGSGDSLQTRGFQLVRTFGDVIVITCNYRLGVLGFLGSEKLRRYTYERTGLNVTGNMGFLDQVMVLRWVKENAAAFGGDPNNVMLFGESAGAGGVSAHLTSPFSRGLFHRAAMQSGGFNKWVAVPLHHATDSFNSMVKSMRRMRKYYNTSWATKYQCKPNTTDIQCLIESSIPGKLLVQLATHTEINFVRKTERNGMDTSQWAPTFDGVVLADHPFRRLWHGQWNQVPVIIGANEDDGTEFVDGCQAGLDPRGKPSCDMSYALYEALSAYWKNKTEVDDPKCFQDSLYKRWIRLNWGEKHVAPLYALYNSSVDGTYDTNYWAAEHLVGDYVMFCTQRRAAKLMGNGSVPVFQYHFVRTPIEAPFGKPPDVVVDGYRACHGCEIPFVFFRNDSQELGITGPGETELGLAMASYWTNFAWSGDPNNRAGRWSSAVFTPAGWPRLAATSGSLLLNATEQRAVLSVLPAKDERAARCEAFWDPYFRMTGWFSDEGAVAPSSWRARPRHVSPRAARRQAALQQDVCSPGRPVALPERPTTLVI